MEFYIGRLVVAKAVGEAEEFMASERDRRWGPNVSTRGKALGVRCPRRMCGGIWAAFPVKTIKPTADHNGAAAKRPRIGDITKSYESHGHSPHEQAIGIGLKDRSGRVAKGQNE